VVVQSWIGKWEIRRSGVGEMGVVSLCVLCGSVFIMMMYVLCWSMVWVGCVCVWLCVSVSLCVRMCVLA